MSKVLATSKRMISTTSCLKRHTSLIIWDESASQNHYIIDTVDRSLCDLLNQPNHPFGRMTVVFSGDFRQTLSVIQHGTREQIVPATLTHPNLWRLMAIHYQNICIGQDAECDAWAQQPLHIGITDGDIALPAHMDCSDTMDSLIQALYSQLFGQDKQMPDRYFLDQYHPWFNKWASSWDHWFWTLLHHRKKQPTSVQTVSVM